VNSRAWTDAEVRTLRSRYPDERAADVAKALGRPIGQVYQAAARYGLSKSEAFRASDLSARIRRGKQSPAMEATRFQRGHATWNAGHKGWQAGGRSVETQFKKGFMAGAAQRKYVPIGTERISKDGYLERKITDDPSMHPARRWQGVHRIVWQTAHGPIPPGHAVAFLPGRHTTDAAAITADALELVSRAELMRRNSYLTRYPKDVADLIRMRGVLNRKINHRSKA
jgi:hypothetical protein